MVPVLSDRGHLRGEWDEINHELKVKDGHRTTIYTFNKDGVVTARDVWDNKLNKKSA